MITGGIPFAVAVGIVHETYFALVEPSVAFSVWAHE